MKIKETSWHYRLIKDTWKPAKWDLNEYKWVDSHFCAYLEILIRRLLAISFLIVVAVFITFNVYAYLTSTMDVFNEYAPVVIIFSATVVLYDFIAFLVGKMTFMKRLCKPIELVKK